MRNAVARVVSVSPAMVVAMIALFVALTGTAVATTSALITGAQIRNNSITGADVRNRSLRPIDFRGSVRGPRGLRGHPGGTGAQGPAGAPNPNAVNSDKLDGLDSTDFQKVPTTPQHLVIAGTTVADGNGVGRSLTFYSEAPPGTGEQWCTKTGGVPFDTMPIHLPQGAVITSFRVDYGDDSASSTLNGSAFITRMALFGSGGTYEDPFVTTLPDTPAASGMLASATDSAPSSAEHATIDNTKYAYNVLLSLAAGSSICAVDISYTVAPGFAATAAEPDRGARAAPSTLP